MGLMISRSNRQGALVLAVIALVSEAVSDAGAEVPAANVRAMSLQEALDYARTHQPSLLAAQARITAARAAAEVPRAAWMPLVGATAQVFGATSNNTTGTYMPSFGVDLTRIGGTSASSRIEGTPYASTVVGVGIQQELFDFGRIAAQEAVTDSQVEVTRHAAEASRLDVDLAVANAYFAVVAGHEVLTAAEQAVQRAQVDLDAATAGVKSELLPPINRTRADADLARYEVARVQAQGGLESARATLAAVVGVYDGQLDTAGPTPAVGPLPELEQVLEQAQQRDPDVKAAQSALETQRANTRAISATIRPDVHLTASINARAGGAPIGTESPVGAGFLPVVPNYDAGLVLSWPLFDAVVGRQSNASGQLEDVRREELADVKLRLNATAQQAYVQAQIADQAVPALQRAVDAEKANDDQARARLKVGLATAVEVAFAEDLLVQAEIQLAIGRFQTVRARAQLSRVTAEGL